MIRYLVFLITGLLAVAQAKDEPVWRELSGQSKPSHWLLAFEEAEFIRAKIGNWLPIAIFRTHPDAPLKWKLDYIRRKSNQCELSISFVSTRDREITQKYTWFDKGPDAELTSELTQTDTEIYIPIRQADGSMRRVWLRRADGIDDLSKNVKVSKAMLIWKWENSLPVDL